MKHLAPLLPSIAVLIGLYWLRDAWITLGLYHLGMILYLASSGRRDLLSLALRGSHWLTIPASLICATGGLVLVVLWPWLAEDTGGLAANLAGLGLAGGRWWAFLFYYSLVNPVLEEVFWRGWLAPPARCVHWHDLAFAVYHGLVLVFFIKPPWILVAVGVLIGAAWTWRWMARSWGGLAAAVATHLVADVSIIVAAHFLAGW